MSRVNQDLPPLQLPQYDVIRISGSPDVPAEIAADLLQIGVPAGLIGYEYRPTPRPLRRPARSSAERAVASPSGVASAAATCPRRCRDVEQPADQVLIRTSVHRWSVQPWASGPRSNSRASLAIWASLSRGRPGEPFVRTPASPCSRHAWRHLKRF